MKNLFAAVLLTVLAGPTLALDLPVAGTPGGVMIDQGDDVGRRSGRCPKRGAHVEMPDFGQLAVARSSTCGGV